MRVYYGNHPSSSIIPQSLLDPLKVTRSHKQADTFYGQEMHEENTNPKNNTVEISSAKQNTFGSGNLLGFHVKYLHFNEVAQKEDRL